MRRRLFWPVLVIQFFAGLAFLVLPHKVLAADTDVWSILQHQRIGTNSLWTGTNAVSLPDDRGELTLGPAGQWRFYTFTNDTTFTNLSVLTFLASAVNDPGATNPLSLRTEPDLDLYVSTDETLTNLDAATLAQAWYSAGRGGNETILLQDAAPGVYYIAVNCQSQGLAEFSLLVMASEQPLASQDTATGNWMLRAVPVPGEIQDAAGASAVSSYFLAVAPESILLHRVIVSNLVSHTRPTDLQIAMSHDARQVVLKAGGTQAAGVLLFDDTLENDLPDSRKSDGPGSLRDFAGLEGSGQWLFQYTDTVAGCVGTNNALSLILEAQADLRNGIASTVLPGATIEHALEVPPEATNLTITASITGGAGRLSVSLCRKDQSNSDCQETDLTEAMPGITLVKSKYSNPPLNPGLYLVRLQNHGIEPFTVNLSATFSSRLTPPAPEEFRFSTDQAIADQDITSSAITVNRAERIAGLAVGVRIEHPRISDLALSLISPSGTRVLLGENRGGSSFSGMGFEQQVTNTITASYEGGPLAWTNVIHVGPPPGDASIDYNFFSLPDELRMYRGAKLLFESGLISGKGLWQLPYGPEPLGTLTIVMNEGNNEDTNTGWEYTVTITRLETVHATFTENAQFAQYPIKFAPPPFTNCSALVPESNVVCYLPEESLDRFIGESALGTWTLEIRDRQTGATAPPPTLKSWELLLNLEQSAPLPTILSHGATQTNTIPPGSNQPYKVEVPAWASRATNMLLRSSLPLQLWYNQDRLPTGNSPGDTLLFADATQAEVLFDAQTSPALVPQSTYYLALVNTNTTRAEAVFRTDFDVPLLLYDSPMSVQIGPGPLPRYYAIEVTTEPSLSLVLTNLTGNLDLVLRKGPPLPTLELYDYASFEEGTNAEQILLIPDSPPVALSPGTWYAGIYNRDTGAAEANLILQGTLAPPIISEITVNRFVRLWWHGPSGAKFQVEWAASLDPPVWSPFPQVVASDTGLFMFVDDASLTGDLEAARFYRIVQIP